MSIFRSIGLEPEIKGLGPQRLVYIPAKSSSAQAYLIVVLTSKRRGWSVM